MNKESFIYVVVFTFIATFLFVFIISLADNATSDRVAQNQELVTAQAYLNAAGVPENDNAQVLSDYKALFTNTGGEDFSRAQIGDQTVLVKQFSGQGLWGTITGVIAVNSSVDRILGLDIISHSETPGLGGRIEEDWFKNQFRNEKIPEAGIVVRKGEGGSDSDSENGIVDGITGASLTSSSMQTIVNNEIDTLRKEAAK